MSIIPVAKEQRALLTAHFFRQFFNTELVPRQTEARVTIIQILALVATPGFLIMCALLRKYASNARVSGAAAQLAALNEKCLFIYFSMVVVGFIAALQWDSLFPDRRDYLVFGPLPIDEKTILVSKASSLCLFLVLFSVCVNAFPAILYPLFAGTGILQAFRFTLSHALSVLAGNVFIFFACIAIQGFLLNIIGPRFFTTASRFIQLTLLVSLLTLFFLMPAVSYEDLRQRPALMAVFPPGWFLGLYQTLLTGPSPEFSPLAVRALLALGLAVTGFLISYFLAYRRHVRGTLDARSCRPARTRKLKSFLTGFLQRLLLRNAAERAVFSFVTNTVKRSQIHRAYFLGYFGVGLAFVIMGIATVIIRYGTAGAYQCRPELLSLPLVLGFFALLGLRVAFSIPVQLQANWIFKITEGTNQEDFLSGVRKAMFVLGVAPLLIVSTPVYAMLWGWPMTALHQAFCAVLSLLLIELLICRLDKIPFTCTYLPGSANLKLWWPAYLFGFTNYAFTMTELEVKLLRNPIHFVPFFIVAVALLLAIAAYRARLIRKLPGFRYEAEVPPSAEPLILGSRSN